MIAMAAVAVACSVSAEVIPPGQLYDPDLRQAERLAALGCDFEQSLIGYAVNPDGESVTVKTVVIGELSLRRADIHAEVTHAGKRYAVTAIAEGAFERLSTLGEVSIPPTIKQVGKNAFRECPLSVVHISDLTAWCAIRFDNHTANPASVAHHLFLGDEEIIDLVIPEGVTRVGDYAFDSLLGLQSVTFPDGLRVIGRGVFYGCEGLKSLKLPDSIVTIDRRAFERCTGLTDVYIGDNAEFIGYGAFRDCTALRHVSMPKKVRTVRRDAFEGVKAKFDKRKVNK